MSAVGDPRRIGRSRNRTTVEARIFSDEFILERPLLKAIRQDKAPVLLIDEIDRADEEFEAYLLEILSEFQVTIPETATITAKSRPIFILTANGTRDLSDALRRRCLFTYVPYPDHNTERSILIAGTQTSPIAYVLRSWVCSSLRKQELEKKPGIAEMLDFAAALMGLGVADRTTDPLVLQASLTTLLKTQTDNDAIPTEIAQRLAGKAACAMSPNLGPATRALPHAWPGLWRICAKMVCGLGLGKLVSR